MNPAAPSTTVTGSGVQGEVQLRDVRRARARGQEAERNWGQEVWFRALSRGAAIGVAIGTSIAVAIMLDGLQIFDGVDFVVAVATAGSPLTGTLTAAVAMPAGIVARWHRAAAGAAAAGLAQGLVIGVVWIAAALRGSGMWDLSPAFAFLIPAGLAGGLFGLCWMDRRGSS